MVALLTREHNTFRIARQFGTSAQSAAADLANEDRRAGHQLNAELLTIHRMGSTNFADEHFMTC